MDKSKLKAWGSRAWSWLNNTNPGTWVGHWGQGLLGFWIGDIIVTVAFGHTIAAIAAGVLTGFLVVLAVFWHREGDDLRKARNLYGSWSIALRKKGLDGIMDLLMPILAVFADIQIVYGDFADFSAALAATAFIWTVAMLVDRREQKA